MSEKYIPKPGEWFMVGPVQCTRSSSMGGVSTEDRWFHTQSTPFVRAEAPPEPWPTALNSIVQYQNVTSVGWMVQYLLTPQGWLRIENGVPGEIFSDAEFSHKTHVVIFDAGKKES